MGCLGLASGDNLQRRPAAASVMMLTDNTEAQWDDVAWGEDPKDCENISFPSKSVCLFHPHLQPLDPPTVNQQELSRGQPASLVSYLDGKVTSHFGLWAGQLSASCRLLLVLGSFWQEISTVACGGKPMLICC